MANILYFKFFNDPPSGGTMLVERDVPHKDDTIFFDGANWKVYGVTYFPDGGKGIKEYDKYRKQYGHFVMVKLVPSK